MASNIKATLIREQTREDLRVFTDLGIDALTASGFASGVIAVVEYFENHTGMQMDARALFLEVAPGAAQRIRAKLDARAKTNGDP
jgi:hypothetical protein